MTSALGAKRLSRLDVQGPAPMPCASGGRRLDTVDEDLVAQVAPWLRLAFGLCAHHLGDRRHRACLNDPLADTRRDRVSCGGFSRPSVRPDL